MPFWAVVLLLLSPVLGAAYYLIVCFSLMGIVLLKETHKYISIQRVPAYKLTEAQFSAVCHDAMRSLFDNNGAMLFLYPFLLFTTRMSRKR